MHTNFIDMAQLKPLTVYNRPNIATCQSTWRRFWCSYSDAFRIRSDTTCL